MRITSSVHIKFRVPAAELPLLLNTLGTPSFTMKSAANDGTHLVEYDLDPTHVTAFAARLDTFNHIIESKLSNVVSLATTRVQ